MNRSSVKDVICSILVEINPEIEEIHEEMDLQTDLNLDSVALFQLVAECEDRFDVILQNMERPPTNVGQLIDHMADHLQKQFKVGANG